MAGFDTSSLLLGSSESTFLLEQVLKILADVPKGDGVIKSSCHQNQMFHLVSHFRSSHESKSEVKGVQRTEKASEQQRI